MYSCLQPRTRSVNMLSELVESRFKEIVGMKSRPKQYVQNGDMRDYASNVCLSFIANLTFRTCHANAPPRECVSLRSPFDGIVARCSSSLNRLPFIMLLFAVMLALMCMLMSYLFKQYNQIHLSHPVVLVIAHPDDEAMFFGPTITSLTVNKRDVHILCLSTGNYDGLGHVRTKELIQSCATMGIDRSNVTVLDERCVSQGGFRVQIIHECDR